MIGAVIGLLCAPFVIYAMRKHLDNPVVLTTALAVAVIGIVIAIIISLLNRLFPL